MGSREVGKLAREIKREIKEVLGDAYQMGLDDKTRLPKERSNERNSLVSELCDIAINSLPEQKMGESEWDEHEDLCEYDQGYNNAIDDFLKILETIK